MHTQTLSPVWLTLPQRYPSLGKHQMVDAGWGPALWLFRYIPGYGRRGQGSVAYRILAWILQIQCTVDCSHLRFAPEMWSAIGVEFRSTWFVSGSYRGIRLSGQRLRPYLSDLGDKSSPPHLRHMKHIQAQLWKPQCSWHGSASNCVSHLFFRVAPGSVRQRGKKNVTYRQAHSPRRDVLKLRHNPPSHTLRKMATIGIDWAHWPSSLQLRDGRVKTVFFSHYFSVFEASFFFARHYHLSQRLGDSCSFGWKKQSLFNCMLGLKKQQ